MSDTHQPKRPLSEISHLFLSDVRDRQTNGAPRPVRRPPGSHEPAMRNDISIDLTPEEFAQVFGAAECAEEAVEAQAQAHERAPTVTAVVSAHLNGCQHERVRQYARHLASAGQRIGMLEVDTHEFRLMCFDCGQQPHGAAAMIGAEHALESFDARKMAEAIDEMNWDVDRWLLVLPNPRTPEARGLLREVDRWVMLSTCDHDGVVSCYRMLKGLSDMHRPALTLGLLDVHDETQASRVFRKLSSVCEQFLRWPLTAEPSIGHADQVAEHLVLHCRPTRDKAQLAAAPQWQVAANFLAKLNKGAAAAAQQETPTPMTTIAAPHISPASHEPGSAAIHAATATAAAAAAAPSLHLTDVVVPSPAAGGAVGAGTKTGAHREIGKELPTAAPAMPAAGATAGATPGSRPMMRMHDSSSSSSASDIIDLDGSEDGTAAIITAIVRHAAGELIECPVRPPMCADAHLTIDRDRQLVLLAVAGEGLRELRGIAQAYRWLTENRALVAMALPQFAIDALRLPRLRLLVDHADVSAELLQPMLQSGNITVQAYRKIRWGEKLGLLLEAA